MSAPYWQTLVAAAYSADESPQLDGDLARQHRPTDRATLRAAALELRSRGMTPFDIAETLRLPESAARELLEEAHRAEP